MGDGLVPRYRIIAGRIAPDAFHRHVRHVPPERGRMIALRYFVAFLLTLVIVGWLGLITKAFILAFAFGFHALDWLG